MSISLTYNCDGCGTSAKGISTSSYSPPPIGWLWADSDSDGPHACGLKCWHHVQSAHKRRTGQVLEYTSHDVEVVEEEEAAPPAVVRPEIVPEVVTAPLAVRNGHANGKPANGTSAKAKPSPVVVLDEAEVAEEEAPRRSSKVVPLGGEGKCTECGGELPPPTRGRRRTKCLTCQPKRER